MGLLGRNSHGCVGWRLFGLKLRKLCRRRNSHGNTGWRHGSDIRENVTVDAIRTKRGLEDECVDGYRSAARRNSHGCVGWRISDINASNSDAIRMETRVGGEVFRGSEMLRKTQFARKRGLEDFAEVVDKQNCNDAIRTEAQNRKTKK